MIFRAAVANAIWASGDSWLRCNWCPFQSQTGRWHFTVAIFAWKQKNIWERFPLKLPLQRCIHMYCWLPQLWSSKSDWGRGRWGAWGRAGSLCCCQKGFLNLHPSSTTTSTTKWGSKGLGKEHMGLPTALCLLRGRRETLCRKIWDFWVHEKT